MIRHFYLLLFLAISITARTQESPKQAIFSASLVYHGFSDSSDNPGNTNSEKTQNHYISGALAYAVTAKLSVGYKIGFEKQSTEDDTQGTSMTDQSVFHGPLVRYYIPLHKKISLFTDAVYTHHSYKPTKIQSSDGQEIISDVDKAAHRLGLDYGFAFSVADFISFDIKMNLLNYRVENEYSYESNNGNKTKTVTQKDLDWNLNSYPLSQASIGFRIIFRR